MTARGVGAGGVRVQLLVPVTGCAWHHRRRPGNGSGCFAPACSATACSTWPCSCCSQARAPAMRSRDGCAPRCTSEWRSTDPPPSKQDMAALFRQRHTHDCTRRRHACSSATHRHWAASKAENAHLHLWHACALYCLSGCFWLCCHVGLRNLALVSKLLVFDAHVPVCSLFSLHSN